MNVFSLWIIIFGTIVEIFIKIIKIILIIQKFLDFDIIIDNFFNYYNFSFISATNFFSP